MGGAAPGTLTLINRTTGVRYGPFQAGGSSGQGSASNVNWTANVNLNVPAGAYEVFDSGVLTWSWNRQSNDNGFLKVEGTTPARSPAAEVAAVASLAAADPAAGAARRNRYARPAP